MHNAVFDALIIADAGAEPAAHTLAGLVEGVVDGMVRRVTLLSPVEDRDLLKLADAAGCRLEAGLPPAAYAEALKPHLATPHVLVLLAGALPPPGWPEALRLELQRQGAPAADGALAFRPAGLGARLKLMAAVTGGRRLPLAHGALVPKAVLTARGFDGRAAVVRDARMASGLTLHRMVGC